MKRYKYIVGFIVVLLGVLGFFLHDMHKSSLSYRVNPEGYHDRYGNYFPDKKPPKNSSRYVEGLKRVKGANGKYGYVDVDGVLKINHIFIDASDFSEGLASVLIGVGERGYIDKKGTIVIRGDYIEAGSFSEGMAVVKLPGSGLMRGYIDRDGNVVLPPKYFEAFDFKDGRAYVMEEVGKYKYIDKEGNEVPRP